MNVTSYSTWPAGTPYPGSAVLGQFEDRGHTILEGSLVAAAMATFWLDGLLSATFIRSSNGWWLAALPIPGAALLGLALAKPVTRGTAEAAAACVLMAVGAIVASLVVGFFFLPTMHTRIIVFIETLGLFGWPTIAAVVPSTVIWAATVRYLDRSDPDIRAGIRLVCVSVLGDGHRAVRPGAARHLGIGDRPAGVDIDDLAGHGA